MRDALRRFVAGVARAFDAFQLRVHNFVFDKRRGIVGANGEVGGAARFDATRFGGAVQALKRR